MEIHRLRDPEAVTSAVADLITDRLGRALVARGSAVLALSGGSTPKPLYRRLATVDLDWCRVHVVGVDERFGDVDDPARNWVAIEHDLVGPTAAIGHPMPTTADVQPGLERRYARLLAGLNKGVIDVVHLGLGSDGHTASLVPGDPVLNAAGDVAVTGRYDGRRRMTLTASTINRADAIVWQVVGSEKAPALRRLLDGDPEVPAHLITTDGDVHLVIDDAAADELAGAGS